MVKNKKGLFISFESLDGAGKSTHIKLLENNLKARDIPYIVTKEPGGTLIGDKIRQLLLDPENKNMSAMTEILLYTASRAQHVEEVIIPALDEGKVVICDRYIDSSLAYQGYGLELGESLIKTINECATHGIFPDITFYLKLSPEDSLRRKLNMSNRGIQLDRIEQRKLNFHTKVYDGFEILSKEYSDRYFTINATLDRETNRQIIFKHFIDKFTKHIGLMQIV